VRAAPGLHSAASAAYLDSEPGEEAPETLCPLTRPSQVALRVLSDIPGGQTTPVGSGDTIWNNYGLAYGLCSANHVIIMNV